MSKSKLKREFAKKHFLVLGDELQPQVGSGHRYVEAVIGYKWVKVRESQHTNRKRIKRQLWDTLIEQTARYQKRNMVKA